MKIKTNDEQVLRTWEELNRIFTRKNYVRHLPQELNKLGFRVENGKHIKVYIPYKDKNYVVVISKTPSDYKAYAQALRIIRRIFENG